MFWRLSTTRLPAISLLLSAAAVFASDPKPIAHVGPASIGSDALTRRLATIPAFQRAALGDTPEKLKRQVLDTWLVPELLYAQEAERLKLGQRPSVQRREREILRQAIDRQLRGENSAHSPVTAPDIQAYFTANRRRFETPARVRVWRILTDDEALAKRILAESKGVDGIDRWSKFARESSLDTATRLRNGDLGFIHPDGNTDTPSLRVDPALFAAADKLSDGELALEPIREGSHFAVIWRRGSMKAVTRTLEQEQGSIRQVLQRQRSEQARAALLADLQGKYVSLLNEAALDNVRFDSESLPVRATAPASAHPAAAGSSIPQAGERGER